MVTGVWASDAGLFLEACGSYRLVPAHPLRLYLELTLFNWVPETTLSYIYGPLDFERAKGLVVGMIRHPQPRRPWGDAQ